MLSPVAAATIGSAALCLSGLQSWSNFANLWSVWWLGDALGATIVAPVILTFTRTSIQRITKSALEAAGLLSGIFIVVGVLFQAGENARSIPIQYLAFPLLIWAALRFGPWGAATSTFLTAALTVWQTSRGVGPFATGAPADDLVLLQLFMATLSTTSLLFAAAIAERQDQHALLQAVMEGSNDAIFLKDRSGRYLTINSAGARFIGRPIEQIIGLDDSELFTSPDAQALMVRDRSIMESGVGNTQEETVQSDSDLRTFSSMKAPYRDSNQEVVGLVGIARDVTETKASEEAARTEYDLRKAIESSIRAGIAAINEEGIQTYANRAFCQMVGWSEDELIGRKAPFVYWPRDEIGTIQHALKLTIERRVPIEGFELRFQRRSGEIFPVHIVLSPLLNDSGHVRWWVASVHDITMQVRNRDALLHSEERYKSLVLATSQVVWHTTSDGDVLENLPTWTAFTGQPPEEARGRGWLSMVHPEDMARVGARWEASLKSGLSHEDEFRVRVSDGSYRYVSARAVPVHDERGMVREWVGTLTDITGRKLLELKRAELLEIEQERSRRKDDFLAMLAHELRNPLAPIMTAASILEQPASPGVVQRSVAVIKRQAGHLTHIIEDLLDVARITRGAIELRTEPLDFSAIVRTVADDLRPVLETREQQLTLAVPSSPVMVAGDATRLEQVATNLLQNATKYTHRGGSISVSLKVRDSHAVLEVRDTGKGIAKEFLPQVFDLFSQEDRSLDRNRGGLGLGLSIVQSIVRLHGGEVSAFSEGEGKGATFIVTLPLTRTERSVATGSSDQHIRPLRIMIIEDNEDSAELLSLMLSMQGHQVRAFNTAYEALNSTADFLPQVVLLDVGLPGMSGYEAAPRIRVAYPARSIKIVALTGYGQPEDRQKTAAAGFDFHLVKPADPDLIDNLLREFSIEIGDD